jgi:transcription termination factor Rho
MRLLLILLFFLFVNQLFAQSVQNRKKEKCFVHLDKNRNLVDDTLWFQTYILEDNFHYLQRFQQNYLYWNPNVRIPENGVRKVSFYNGDHKARIIGILQGVGRDDEPGVTRFRYNIE